MTSENSHLYGVSQIEQRFRAVKEQPLEIGEILPFIITANPDSLEDQIKWYGAGHPNTPISQFHTALKTQFPTLSDEDKEEVLNKGLRFATLDFTRQTSETVHNPGLNTFTYDYQLYAGGAFAPRGQDYLRNYSTYLLTLLDFTDGNLTEAKRIIKSAPYQYDNSVKRSVGTLSSFLYRGDYADRGFGKDAIVAKGHAVKEQFQAAHPKARALAFIADAQIGTFNIDGINGDINLDIVLEEKDPAIITQVLVYLREKLAADNEPGYGKTHAVIAKALGHKKHLYETVKLRSPQAQFVLEYEAIQSELRLRKLEDSLGDGRIHPTDLVEILSRSPRLIEDVSIKELYKALDASSNHETARRLAQLIQFKKDRIRAAS